MGRVNNKVVIVTGAAKGMGAAFAEKLVSEGAYVVLTDVDVEAGQKLASEIGGNAYFMRLDVASEAEWREVIRVTEARFGYVSVLVNNAGIVSYAAVEVLEESDFRRIIDVNQVGVFLGMKSVFGSMKSAGGGSIINMSSVAGLVGNPNLLSYTATKFAVRGMTKTAAIEFAPHNVRVNSIHPGTNGTKLSALAAHF